MDWSDGDRWAAVIALVALAVTVYAQWRSDRLAHYGELDRMYLDVLAMAVERPYLRDPIERARLLAGGAVFNTPAPARHGTAIGRYASTTGAAP